MKITFFNRNDTDIDFFDEAAYLHPLILVSDAVKYISITSFMALLYTDLKDGTGKMSDEFLITMHKRISNHDEQTKQIHLMADKLLPIIKVMKRAKHQNKHSLIALGNFRSIIKIMKQSLMTGHENMLKNISMVEVLPFIKEGVFEAELSHPYTEETKTEDPYIHQIAEVMTGKESIFLLDAQVEGLFRFVCFAKNIEEEEMDDKQKEVQKEVLAGVEGIKFVLWEFPFVNHLNYNQLKYTREQLKPLLEPFKQKLKEFSAELSEMRFTEEYFKPIGDLIFSKLFAEVAPVQKAINESMYIIQAKNQLPAEYCIKLCLGVTSAENLIDYYEKIKVVFPFSAQQLKEQVKRHIDLKQAFPFFHLLVNMPDTQKSNMENQE